METTHLLRLVVCWNGSVIGGTRHPRGQPTEKAAHQRVICGIGIRLVTRCGMHGIEQQAEGHKPSRHHDQLRMQGMSHERNLRHERFSSGFPCEDRKSTRLNSSHPSISYAVFCLKKKKKTRCRRALSLSNS